MGSRDPLTEVLDLLRVRGAVMGRLRAHAPWGLRLSHAPSAVFHAVTAGACWLRIPEHEPRELVAGDVALLPSGASHVVASAPTGPARPWNDVAKARARTEEGEIVLDGPGGPTHVLCATYEYDCDVAHPLLTLLPPALFVSSHETAEAETMQATLNALHHELASRPGAWGTVVDRLIDVLFVQVIRAWVANDEGRETSWLGALRDPGIARALTLMHAKPAAPWTLATLARETSLSRATLTRRFTALVGEPPLSYLTRWRMDLAAKRLRETNDPVSTIARRVGYMSEFAFSRAFARVRGNAPGRYRLASRSRPRGAESPRDAARAPLGPVRRTVTGRRAAEAAAWADTARANHAR
jgi:AraC-like DNA-binding protein